MAGSEAAITVRLLTSLEEFEQAVCVQREIWGFDEIELFPTGLFLIASKIGGQSFGAFDGARMVGFTLAVPGLKHTPGATSPYLHSHMLGVLPGYRDRGVGRMLKLAQRARAIEDGLDLIEWTFDPLELKNAFFNIERLGAIVRRYVLNQYGTTTSHLHGSLPTDRCIAEWWLTSPRVEALLAGRAPERPPIADRIEVPSQRTREVQQRVSARFLEAFERGLTVVGFERPGAYLLADVGQALACPSSFYIGR